MITSPLGWYVLLASLTLAGEPSTPEPESVTLSGQVVELADALKPLGVPFEAEPIARQVVLIGRDGTITPLLSDNASRALFLDGRLRRRPAEIQARRFPGNPYVQVISFRVDDQGTMRIPEYYCEICSISVRSPQICPCCQGPMELRMRPEDR